MAGLSYDKIIKYKLVAICDGPLHIGSAVGGKEEVLIHPVDGNPFVQASSIAGALRAYYEKIASKKAAEALFGTGRNASAEAPNSRAKFQDGTFVTNTVKMELRPHVKIDRATGSATSENGSGQKFDLEYVGKGSKFTTEIYLLLDTKKNVDLKAEFDKILAGLADGHILFGAKKSSGAGKIKLEKLLMREFDMKVAADRTLWKTEEDLKDSAYTDYLTKLPKATQNNLAYRLVVTGKTEGPLQVKAIAMSDFGKDAPDSQNIKNAEGNYIVPGSAFRGVIKSQMEKIEKYLGKKEGTIINDSFGKAGENQNDSYAGNLIFSDTVIVNEKYNDPKFEEIIRNRIHIDKFTGGVINGGKFNEQNVTGKMIFTIDILDKNHPDATLGLLLLALRDLAIKNLSLGNGFATGKGFVDVEKISIKNLSETEENLKETDISFKTPEKMADDAIVKKALNAVKEVPSCQ